MKRRTCPAHTTQGCRRCFAPTGIVDHTISLRGRWVPVEAKLNLAAERDIAAQVAKYAQIDTFRPRKGMQREGTYATEAHVLCLVVDQTGLYMLSGGHYLDCSAEVSLWHRSELSHVTSQDIRASVTTDPGLKSSRVRFPRK